MLAASSWLYQFKPQRGAISGRITSGVNTVIFRQNDARIE